MTASRSSTRRALQWLGESPDAAPTAAAAHAAAPTAASAQPTATRPRKAERRAARRAAFYAERRRAAPGPRALFEVAADQVRALDNERALTAATVALDGVIARFGR